MYIQLIWNVNDIFLFSSFYAFHFSIFLVWYLIRKISQNLLKKIILKNIFSCIASSNINYRTLLERFWQCLFTAIKRFIISNAVILFLRLYLGKNIQSVGRKCLQKRFTWNIIYNVKNWTPFVFENYK